MQMSDCKSMQFTWLGNGTAGNRKSALNYESFRLGNLHISVGDFVLVRNDDSVDPEDFSNSFVAQVKELFDTGVEPDPHQAKVQWFSRVSELPSFALKFIDQVDSVNEVVAEKRINWSDIIDADTIFHKCLVLFLGENDDHSSFVSEYEDSEFPVFFCRYRFTGRRVLPIIQNDGTPSSKSISLTPKQRTAAEVTQRERNERKEAFYSAATIGDSFLPKVLIKKMDDRILESQNGNVRIFIAQTHAEPMEKLNAKFEKNLSLNAKTNISEGSPSKGKPIIHSLRLTSNCGDQNLKSNVSVYGCDDVLEESDSPNTSKTYNIRSNKRKARRSLFSNASEKLSKPSVRCSRRKSVANTLQSVSPQKKSRYSFCHIETSPKKINSITRFGRKVKSVNYHVARGFHEDNEKLMTSSNCIKKKSHGIIQIDSSDEEGSVFSCSSVDNSDDSVSIVSDCSLLDKDCKPISPRNKSKQLSVKKGASKLSLPKRETPLKTPQNVLEESRQRLHVSTVPKSLPCREEEYSDIYSFVKGCLCAHTGGCMYISGVPGTGKTATVHEVIRNLEQEKESGDVPIFSFVEVNGMWLTDPYQCYVQIFKSLTGETRAPQQAANLLEKRFTEKGPKKDAVVLLVDELDRLWTRKQTVMYNIFDWPSKKNSKLIVLAIANTMDLPERLMMNRISSRLGLTRKTFQPYTFKQLQEIIMSRIQELQAFDPDAVQLVARKVAAISGDARRALDICRFATEVVTSTKSSPKKKCKVLIGMEHVDIALQQMFSSPLVLAIRSSSNIAKLFFRGMLSEFMRTGSEETTLLRIHQQVVAACRFEGQNPPNFSEVHNICAHLAASHLILVDGFQNDLHMKIRLNVSSDDVNYALTGK